MIASTRDERERINIRKITRRDFVKTAAVSAAAAGSTDSVGAKRYSVAGK
jgi:hypothetical protein